VADRSASILAGKHVVITRPAALAQPIADALEAQGAIPVLLPVVRIEPPVDFHQLDDALRDFHENKFEWVIFGSQNAVSAVMARAAFLNLDLSQAKRAVKVAAVGRVTAIVAEKAGFKIAHVGKGTGADLITELAPGMHHKHVFLPRSDRAGAAHFAQLHQAGAYVREVVAYRTVPSKTLEPASIVATNEADAILFFSPSAVHAFVSLVQSGVLQPVRDSTGIGAIGPVTAENLVKEAKMRCDFEPHDPTGEQVIAALSRFFEKRNASSAGAASR
jgi:uroporphyrinogen-III synthase